MLLEGKPLKHRIGPLAAGASAGAKLDRFLVPGVIVAEVGVLGLVLVVLLHPRDFHLDVEVYVADITWNDRAHTDEAEFVVDTVAVLQKSVFLLDVASVAERQPHYQTVIGVGSYLEGEILGLDILSRIHIYGVVALVRTEDVQIGTVVVVVVLDKG